MKINQKVCCKKQGFLIQQVRIHKLVTGAFNPAYVSGGANGNMDLAGLLMQFYDDGQYKVMANALLVNMLDIGNNINIGALNGLGVADYSMSSNGFHDVGDMTGAIIITS